MTEAHHHRATLKQSNKSFKSKHATKSSLKDIAKGRIPRQSVKSAPASATAAQSRLNRRNNAKQAQSKKRSTLISATRIFNGVDGAPRIIAVIPLTPDVSARNTVVTLAESLDVDASESTENGVWKLKATRFKTSLQFLTVPYKNIYAALDACKVADYVLFVLSPTEEVNEWGDTLLRTLQAQGLPEVVTILDTPSSQNAPTDVKSRSAILKSLLSFIQYFVPSQTRVFDLTASSDKLNAVRAVAEGKPADVRWREGRSWLLSENVDWEASGSSENEGVLKVTGVIRGSRLCANRLVHIPSYGDFQLEKIISAPLPRAKTNAAAMEIEPTVLAEPEASSADSLVSSNDPDDMANEQTWPTEDEMNGAGTVDQTDIVPDAVVPRIKPARRIPKGMSEYQAAWIVDEDDSGSEGSQGDDGEDKAMKDIDDEQEWQDEPEEEEMVDMPERDTDVEKSVMFQDLDEEEDAKQLASWRSRDREELDNLNFPDEIDTPKEIAARVRFQRFRGMRSFRTSPWDAYENLPRDYARIFQFEDFKRTERGIRKRADEEIAVVEPGVRVTVCIKGVPREAAQSIWPTVLFGLLQHEHKVSVLNFTVQRNTEYTASVRSKDPLILCIGPRRLQVNPVYSQHTRGGGKGSNNVHKFERYLKNGITSVATTYGPVCFGKQSCILLREVEGDSQAPQLVATGTFMNPDTTRVIAKRIILTGHPFKVHKKVATVRYMFFNPEDVAYFKPIALHTKLGRTGHIRESLGTHGYLKAHFDGPITQMDTICMSLYKRVFPKWGTLWKEGKRNDAADTDAMQE